METRLSEENGREGTVIDAHIHLDLYEQHELQPMLEEAFRSGVEAVVAVSMHLASCKVNEGLANRYPGRVHPAYGFHPEQELPGDEERERLLEWIRARHIRGEAFAIGEVGLPYYMRTEREAAGQSFDETPYLVWLESFVKLAAELDRPIVLHTVYEDADKACDLLQRYGVRRAHFHWFKGSAETITRMIESGYYVSITPDVAYEPEIIELVERYPIDLLMAETDGPWPFEGPYNGRRTTPDMAKYAAADIARIKGMAVEEAAHILLRNTKNFYGIL
ncbi:TatD family hydrolase [Paenibacillus paeoniae]|uniref:TatD family deoxyribonuclease n=1 Tax=Paenibacillus paeoniae TaxID=2292705 RepID=A0A371PJW4_9BACL|nr:TatD family hydrolase [Paenibacillus paeoniae]REK76443.1 TatD family deoxyribonuclease [Paenibacillus paeoniae]